MGDNKKPNRIAKKLAKSGIYLSTSDGIIREYIDNYWQRVEKYGKLDKSIIDNLGDDASKKNIGDVKYLLATYVNKPELNLHVKNKLIPVINGMYSLNDKKLYEHDKKYLNTYVLNVKYDKEAKCEKWLKFLDDIFKDDSDKKQKIESLQMFLGLCMTTETKYQVCVLLSGEGNNGKGVLIEIVVDILKPTSASIGLSELSNPNRTIILLDKTFAYDKDLSRERFSDGAFKKAVAGEELTMKALYHDSFSSKINAKFLFASNSLPITKDISGGYFRRWIILKFNQNFKGRENRNLIEELKAEKPGIFNWMLEGLRKLDSQKHIPIPESSENAIAEYKNEASSVIAFCNDRVDTINSGGVTGKFLNQAYVNYCKVENFTPIGRNKLFTEIEKIMAVKRKTVSNVVKFEGIVVVNEINDIGETKSNTAKK